MYWPFFMHPELAVALALFLLVGFAIARICHVSSKWMLIASCLWFVYAAWEQFCTIGNYNIRVDLLVIPWVLCSVTVLALVATGMQFFRKVQV